VRVEQSDLTYPLVDGIVDLCGQAQDRIIAAYDAFAPRYDKYITSSTLPMKLCSTIIWGIGDDRTYADTVLSYLPGRFDGVLLDVPVGTAVFTSSVYARFPNATIVCVDSSMGMLQKARRRFEQQGLKNVCLVRADVTNLPVRNAAVDIVLSMNGWHVFADKQRAIAEIRRVLRSHGCLLACGYVKGVRKLADWFVRHFGVRNGFFNPPFFDLNTMAQQFEGFTMSRQGDFKSIAYFEAVKNG
jgi:ubiquinone/menaquinone biosynthesis C-methylase UbiE